MEWFIGSKNSKHFDDVVGIIRVQEGGLDSGYIGEQLKTARMKECWKKAKNEGVRSK
jgi:hypothetical protein